jgi:hypothetical protein
VGHSVPRSGGQGEGSRVDVELLAQGQVLESAPAVAADEEREESKQVEQEASAGRVGMLRFFLVAAFGLGLTTSVSAQTDANRWQRHPERCVEEACRHLSPRDCNDATNVNRLLQACAANYDGQCVRACCGLLSARECNELSEVTMIAGACSNNVDGDCVTSICRRLGSTDCDSLEEVARVAIQCGRANPYPVPYPMPYPVPYR